MPINLLRCFTPSVLLSESLTRSVPQSKGGIGIRLTTTSNRCVTVGLKPPAIKPRETNEDIHPKKRFNVAPESRAHVSELHKCLSSSQTRSAAPLGSTETAAAKSLPLYAPHETKQLLAHTDKLASALAASPSDPKKAIGAVQALEEAAGCGDMSATRANAERLAQQVSKLQPTDLALNDAWQTIQLETDYTLCAAARLIELQEGEKFAYPLRVRATRYGFDSERAKIREYYDRSPDQALSGI